MTKEKIPDIEAWAVIDDIEGDDTTPHVPAMAAEYPVETQCELYDSGASRHMSSHHKQFITYREISAHSITAANDKVFHAVSMGNLQIRVPNGATLTSDP